MKFYKLEGLTVTKFFAETEDHGLCIHADAAGTVFGMAIYIPPPAKVSPGRTGKVSGGADREPSTQEEFTTWAKKGNEVLNLIEKLGYKELFK